MQNMMNARISVKDLLTFVFFLSLDFAIAIRFSQMHTAWQSIATAWNILAVVAFCLKWLLRSRITLKAFLSVCFLLVLGIVYSAYYSGIGILNIVMALLVAKDLSIKRIMHYNLFAIVLAVSFIVFTSVAGITDMHAKEMTKMDAVLNPYSFGFVSSNTPSILMLPILTAYNLSRGRQLKNKEIFVEFSLTAAAYVLFYARTGTITFLIYLTGLLICNNAKSARAQSMVKLLFWPCQFIYFIVLGITFYLVTHYDTSIALIDVNLMLSDRLHLWSTLLYYSGVHFLGNTWIVGELQLSMDNAYVFFLIAYGVCMLILYGFIFTYVAVKAYRRSDWALLMVVIAYSIYGFGENQVFDSTVCNVLLLFSCLFLNPVGDKKIPYSLME